MMRSAQLADCLASPNLWFDATARSLTKTDIEHAEQHLKAAREQKDPIEQTNASYKSMYNSAQALVHSIGYKTAGFRCLVTVLVDYFVKKALLDQVQVDNLKRAQQILGVPAENVQNAETFLNAAKTVLKI